MEEARIVLKFHAFITLALNAISDQKMTVLKSRHLRKKKKKHIS